MITTEELIKIIENESIEKSLKFIAENLFQAVEDWPIDVNEPSELISVLKSQIDKPLTFNNIENHLKKLSLKKDGWKMESLSSLLNIFDIASNENVDEEVELEVLLERLTNRLKN